MKTRCCSTICALALGCIAWANSGEATVIATSQRTIFQPLTGYTASDLHFVTYQADRETAWIEDWSISISTAYTSSTTVPGSWPFDDGHTHSVTAEFGGISVAAGASVKIDVSFDLNEYNSVKFDDIFWTYPDHVPVSPMGADIGWGFNVTPGTSSGEWVISKYTIRDMDGNVIGVDLVGHQNATTSAPSLYSMFISNGTPGDPGTDTVKITEWGASQLTYLPTWEEIDTWSDWDVYVPEIVLEPGGSTTVPEPAVTALFVGLTALLPVLVVLRRGRAV